MKKNSKEKYDKLKPDGKAYEELVSEYEREQMPDYSFKNRSQAMGKNAKKLKRIQVLRVVLSLFGAVLVIYLGYFIIAVIKGVNSREQTTTAQHVEVYEPESTTVPQTTQAPQLTTQEGTSGEDITG